MNSQLLVADHGVALDVEARCDGARWLAVAHAGSLRHRGAGVSIWIQLRGVTRVTAREGEFALRRGDWLVLERDASPELRADRGGLTIGLVLGLPTGPTNAAHGSGEGRRPDPLPGLGVMRIPDLRIALRLWRNGARPDRNLAPDDDAPPGRALQAMSAHLASLQHDYDAAIARCPGRSIARKRQVFARMQRAWLFLQGHRDRVVRLGELAELTNFSSWYLSKTFHEIYGECPQSASVRMRLERACELLAAQEGSIGEVGVACGFDNSCSFARAFRGRYGVTASEYRHSCVDMWTGATVCAARTLAQSLADAKHDANAAVAERDISMQGCGAFGSAKIGTVCEPKRTRDRRDEAVLCVGTC